MRWFTVTCILLPLIIASTSAEWSWGQDSKGEEKKEEKPTELLQGEEMPEAQEKSSDSNSTVLDDIVDELISRKQGRSLGGFDDDVYSDPTIKEALDAGDDAEARNLIKGRLCTLGLIQVSIHYYNGINNHLNFDIFPILYVRENAFIQYGNLIFFSAKKMTLKKNEPIYHQMS